jgi:hypothetical protein
MYKKTVIHTHHNPTIETRPDDPRDAETALSLEFATVVEIGELGGMLNWA